jgi:hypothetical protein
MSSRTGEASFEPRSVAAEIPDRIVLKRHRDLSSLGFNRPARYAILALLGLVLVLGLANVFGQHPQTVTARSAKADLELYAPDHLRGGLLYEARFTIRAHESLKHAVLQLAPGWTESQQMNTIAPSPLAQTSRNGSLLLTLGPVKRGEHYTLYVEFQVNPTNVGRRSTDVLLYDGNTQLLAVDRTITVFP